MYNLLQTDTPKAIELPIVEDASLGYKIYSAHVFNSLASNENANGLSYAEFNFREPLVGVLGYKLANFVLDAPVITPGWGCFTLLVDTSAAAPASYWNGIPSNAIHLIPGNRTANPLIFNAESSEWTRWRYPVVVTSMKFEVRLPTGAVFNLGSGGAFYVQLYLEHLV